MADVGVCIAPLKRIWSELADLLIVIVAASDAIFVAYGSFESMQLLACMEFGTVNSFTVCC